MNRVFLIGKLQGKPEVVYTPKGEKVVMFPLRVEEGDFNIDVVFIDREGTGYPADTIKARVMVGGSLARVPGKGRDALRLTANKILWMEE
ncbi:MAG: hypothetical protein A4E65_01272 [Syntrophorhabdus sp. PtaU1.Bin153]|nr:MAG: hypothetical protein A4E65_01272 [Syntrophorhabdus sp. PtaU1.Bin153]